MVGHRPKGGFGHRVHHAAGDQVDDVAGVGVGRVLHPGGGPQGPLRSGPGPGEGLPAAGGEDLVVVVERQSGVGDRGRATQRLGLDRADGVEALVDLGVDAADEERRDRGQPGQVAARGPGVLDAVEEGVDHLGVAPPGEDQRHVDADALGQALGDGRQAGDRRRDLDEQVGPVDKPPQLAGLGDGLLGVVREAGVDLDGHPAVDAVGGVVGRAQHVAGPAHVEGGDHAEGFLDPDATHGEVMDLPVVVVAPDDRLLEDRRIRRHAHDVTVPDQPGQAALGEAGAAEVVEPDRHPGRASDPGVGQP